MKIGFNNLLKYLNPKYLKIIKTKYKKTVIIRGYLSNCYIK